MKRLQIILSLILFSTFSFAQEFEVPATYRFLTSSDYAKFEPQVLECAKWLTSTPVSKDKLKRQKANAFLLSYLGANKSKLKLKVNPNVLTFAGTSPELLNVFMAGWTQYALENDGSLDKQKGNMAGINAALDFYAANKADMSKDKNVEKFLKMRAKESLDEYVATNAIAED